MTINSYFNIEKIRGDFPILQREIRPGIPLVYLDSSATSQKPELVIQSMEQYYRRSNANIHRGIHTLAEEATLLYENAREKIAKFIHASSPKEIIFTRNTTESINLVAYTWGRRFLNSGDMIILTEMEHHSNIIPWQIIAQELNLRLEYIQVKDDGTLDMDDYHRLLLQNPRLVAFTHMSNVLGTINPAVDMIQAAHDFGAITLLDGAQSVPHFLVDIQALNVDFLAFSAHKMCGPTGIGVLYGKQNLLESMPPFLGGGDMIKKVQLHSFSVNDLPHKFEAGTPAIAEAIGFGSAVDYLSSISMNNLARYEHEVVSYAMERLEEIPGVRLIGPSAEARGGVVAFTLEGIHPHDISQILDLDGVAIRAGHHCAMPLHNKLNLPATARASFYLYNTTDEVDHLVNAIYRVKKMFS